VNSALSPERRFGAALAVSLVVHAAAMTLSLPAARLAAFEAPAPLQVRLLEPPPAPPAIELRKPLPPVAARPRQQSAPKVVEAPKVVQAPKVVEAPKVMQPPQAVAEEVPEPVTAPITEPVIAAPTTPPPPPPVAVYAPAAPPAPPVPAAELLASYGKTISQALARYKEYPRIAQMRGWEGSLTMQLRVAPSGHLLDAALRTSSGHPVLDEQALAMAARAKRFPEPPEGLRDGEIVVLVPVVFRLSP